MTTYQSMFMKRQTGSVLLEAMVAVVIFSFGILAMISMQSAAVRSTADAKYRADASFLANQVVGEMWGDTRSQRSLYSNVAAADVANCNANANLTGSGADWQTAVHDMLPGADKNRQKIFVNTDGSVTVRVCWLDRSSSAGDYHSHVITANVNKND